MKLKTGPKTRKFRGKLTLKKASSSAKLTKSVRQGMKDSVKKVPC